MGELHVQRMGRGMAWLEEIAWQKGYISDDQLLTLAHPLKKNGYGQYLLKLLEDA